MTRREWIGLAACLPAAAQTADEYVRALAVRPPAMQFKGGDAETFRRWQRQFRDKLESLLGPYRPPARWETVRERSVDCGDHLREELLLRSPDLADLPVHLLLPRAPGRRPAVLALHGHGAYGHDSVAGIDSTAERRAAIAQSNYDYGRQLARRGYVAAVPCFMPFGRRLGPPEVYKKEDPCGITATRLRLFGKVLMAENLRDALWAFELLAAHPRVRADRIACAGLSLGGRMTMLAAALEPRIRAAVISGALNMLQERVRKLYSCGAQVIPGLLQWGDVPEIASLIAPRQCLWEVGDRDPLMVKDWIPGALERMRLAWTAAGAPGRLQVDRFDGAHRWNGLQAYPMLESALA